MREGVTRYFFKSSVWLLFAAAGIFPAACTPSVPTDRIPVKLIRNENSTTDAAYQYDASGRLSKNAVRYWLYIPQNIKGNLHVRVTSAMGDILLEAEGSPLRGRRIPCRPVLEPGIKACAVDIANPREGALEFVLTGESSRAYALFVGLRSRDPLF